MIRVLIDHNIEGQAHLLWSWLVDSGWTQVAELTFIYFAEVGLPDDSSDRVIWRFAQTQRMYLLTANRNRAGDDSLGQTLLDENSPTALPVITLANVDRIAERTYREACANRLLEIVLYPEIHLGTGRQFIP